MRSRVGTCFASTRCSALLARARVCGSFTRLVLVLLVPGSASSSHCDASQYVPCARRRRGNDKSSATQQSCVLWPTRSHPHHAPHALLLMPQTAIVDATQRVLNEISLPMSQSSWLSQNFTVDDYVDQATRTERPARKQGTSAPAGASDDTTGVDTSAAGAAESDNEAAAAGAGSSGNNDGDDMAGLLAQLDGEDSDGLVEVDMKPPARASSADDAATDGPSSDDEIELDTQVLPAMHAASLLRDAHRVFTRLLTTSKGN